MTGTRHPEDSARPAAELTLRGLRIFVALAEAGTIAAAATRLGLSPSGVSQHITQLETAVGARLFDRRARPVALTPAGTVLRQHARRVLSAVSEAQAELAGITRAALPRLSLAIIDDLDASLTPVLVGALRARLPGCFVHAFSGRSDEVVARLQAREADIGVSAVLPEPTADYRIFPILRESFVLVTARGAIAPGAGVRAALDALPFVRYSDTLPIGRKIAAHLGRVGLNPPDRVALEATRSVLATVVQTGGWTLTTPLNLLDAEPLLPALDIRPLPFAGETRHVQLIARAGELGHLPEELARDCRLLARERLLPRFDAAAPLAAGAITLPGD